MQHCSSIAKSLGTTPKNENYTYQPESFLCRVKNKNPNNQLMVQKEIYRGNWATMMLGRAGQGITALKKVLFQTLTINRFCEEKYAREKLGNHHDVEQGIAAWKKLLETINRCE